MAGVVPLPSTIREEAIASSDVLAPALHSNIIDALPNHWQLPEADIDRCIGFSRVRCVFSLVSLLLLVTDIPRTGLGVRDVFQLFPSKVGPSSAAYFGPWAYPVVHIQRDVVQTSSSNAPTESFSATKGNNAISTATVWSYEYDSTSVGMRGIAQLLNVSMLPQSSHATAATLELRNAWTNLDVLVASIQQFVSRPRINTPMKITDPQLVGHFSFGTEHLWVDRLHHFLFQFASTSMRWRLHTIHAFTKTTATTTETLNICAPTRQQQPIFCTSAFQYECKHPTNASLPKVPLWDHVDLRTAALQRQYPALALDVTIFTTFNPSTSIASVVAAYFETEVFEIVVLTRGRRCPPSLSSAASTACATVFVDDYRYERGVITANIAEWYSFTATLRAAAQCYVWIRLLLLFYVAYASTHADTSRYNRMTQTLLTMSKIPFQVVVYGSLFPVVAYVLAHFIDCSFVDLNLEMYWTTVDGSLHFDVQTFARHAAIQMRNVWILALAMKTAVIWQTSVVGTWRPAFGVWGVRGIAISLCSMLSVFGPYRSLSFRNSAIRSVLPLAVTSSQQQTVHARPSRLFNVSIEGLPKDMKMTLLAVMAIVLLASVTRGLLYLLRPRYTGALLFGHATLVPYTAGQFWPTTALSARFAVRFTSDRTSTTSAVTAASYGGFASRRVAPAQPIANINAPTTAPSKYNTPVSGRVRRLTRVATNAAVSTCHAWLGIDCEAETQFATERRTLHDVALRLEERTIEMNSLVQLMNLAMMTDPWTCVRLRAVGRRVYFYEPTAQLMQQGKQSRSRIPQRLQTSAPGGPSIALLRVVVLPCSPDQLLAWTGYTHHELRLVGHMSSRDIPWHVLLKCG